MCQPEIGHTLFLIANHFNSKSGDDPLFSFAQPPVLVSEIQRNQQAQIVNDFVDAILALDPNANIVALGDFNDFQFSTPLATSKGGVLTDLITGLPTAEQRYSYVYDGNAQVLDHILISNHLLTPNERPGLPCSMWCMPTRSSRPRPAPPITTVARAPLWRRRPPTSP
ncbi:hypothetical protein [Candidatus Amarolinea dominans]|uniref:endonuclease/exonuclease/phosphatase family protein n=1 Tax=Candidatus Amarolinea dominans TaxID=3140696 RepID=UPI001DEFD0C0|nr:hypothetical protein [Anaerolineae bacterium]